MRINASCVSSGACTTRIFLQKEITEVFWSYIPILRLWSQINIPNTAIESDTSDRPQDYVGNCFGPHVLFNGLESSLDIQVLEELPWPLTQHFCGLLFRNL